MSEPVIEPAGQRRRVAKRWLVVLTVVWLIAMPTVFLLSYWLGSPVATPGAHPRCDTTVGPDGDLISRTCIMGPFVHMEGLIAAGKRALLLFAATAVTGPLGLTLVGYRAGLRRVARVYLGFAAAFGVVAGLLISFLYR